LELDKVVGARHYVAGQRLRARLYEEARAALARADLLALPATALPSQRVETLTVRLGDRELGVQQAIARLTGPFNLTGLPALPRVLPAAGLARRRRRLGGRRAGAVALGVGRAYQQRPACRRPPPPLASA